MSGHLPLRPSWDCGACGQPWPCDPAREYLAAEQEPALLPIYMAAQMTDAATELAAISAEELFERFITWTRPDTSITVLMVNQRPIGRARVSTPAAAWPAARTQAITDPELHRMWNNRRLLSERLGWPDGTLETCEWLDSEHPGWMVFWRDVSARHPAAFVATRIGGAVKVCASTARAVALAMEVAPAHADGPSWRRDRCCHRG